MTTIGSTKFDPSNILHDGDGGTYGVKSADIDLSTHFLPPPANLPSGDIGAEIAAMVVVNANANKASAQQLRRSEQAMEKVAQDREIAVMRKEAELKLAMGVLGIVGHSVSGALSILGAGAGVGAAQGSAQAATASGLSEAGGTIGGIIKGVDSVIDAEITHKQADAKEFANEAATARDAAADAKDAVDDAKKLADKAIDFYSQWVQGQASAAQAALHRS